MNLRAKSWKTSVQELHGKGCPGLLWLGGLGATLFSWDLLWEAGKGGRLSAREGLQGQTQRHRQGLCKANTQQGTSGLQIGGGI